MSWLDGSSHWSAAAYVLTGQQQLMFSLVSSSLCTDYGERSSSLWYLPAARLDSMSWVVLGVWLGRVGLEGAWVVTVGAMGTDVSIGVHSGNEA